MCPFFPFEVGFFFLGVLGRFMDISLRIVLYFYFYVIFLVCGFGLGGERFVGISFLWTMVTRLFIIFSSFLFCFNILQQWWFLDSQFYFLLLEFIFFEFFLFLLFL